MYRYAGTLQEIESKRAARQAARNEKKVVPDGIPILFPVGIITLEGLPGICSICDAISALV